MICCWVALSQIKLNEQEAESGYGGNLTNEECKNQEVLSTSVKVDLNVLHQNVIFVVWLDFLEHTQLVPEAELLRLNLLILLLDDS